MNTHIMDLRAPPTYCCCAGWLARIGSGFFLIIQMVILLDFVQCWNDNWAANGEEDNRWYYALLSLTGVCYALALTLAGAHALVCMGHPALRSSSAPPAAPARCVVVACMHAACWAAITCFGVSVPDAACKGLPLPQVGRGSRCAKGPRHDAMPSHVRAAHAHARAGLLYYWFKPAGAGSCSMNVAFVTLTLLLCVGFSLLSLHPVSRGGSIFPAACISLYCM